MFNEMINDKMAGGDGTNLRVDMEMPIYEFINGKIVRTNLNNFSDGEIISNGVSTLTAPLNISKIPISGKSGKVLNTASDQVIGYGAGKIIEKVADDNNNNKWIMFLFPFLGLWLRFIFIYRCNWKAFDKAYQKNKEEQRAINVKVGAIGFVVIILLVVLYQTLIK